MRHTRYEKPRPKKVDSLSKAVAQILGKEVRLDRPYHNKTKKKTEVTSKTDRHTMATIARVKLK